MKELYHQQLYRSIETVKVNRLYNFGTELKKFYINLGKIITIFLDKSSINTWN